MEIKPKIKVNGPGWNDYPEPLDFDQARLLPFCQDILISVDDQIIASFEELESLAGREPYNQKPVLEITLLPIMVGG